MLVRIVGVRCRFDRIAYGHGDVGLCVDVTALTGAGLVFDVVLLTESATYVNVWQIETVWATDGVAVFAKPLEPLARKGNRVGRAHCMFCKHLGRLISHCIF